MASKRKPAKKRDPNHIMSLQDSDDDEAVALTQSVLLPTVQAALTLKAYGKTFGDLDLSGMVKSLTDQCLNTIDGDLKRSESMLTAQAQAHALDAIFNNLAQRAINAEYMHNLDRYLKLALRAQSQCRSTWEAVANIKNPPLMGYVKQANIAHGAQQVNNGLAPEAVVSRTGEKENSQNKLLEEQDGKRLDTGTTSTTGRVDQDMAAVGAVDRAEVK